jgi:predicted ATPase
VSERYEFAHVLYRQVLYDRQLPGRRARLHHQIGDHLAAMYAQRIEDVVPELAYHFEQAGDWPRAMEYLQRVAEIAGSRCANSLPQQEPLRKAFLSAPAVARIASRAGESP